MLPPSRTKCCHRKVATDAPNVASQMLPATTRRRRDDAEAATAGESLQPPGALTVAAGPRCPHSRCSPPSGLTVVAAHNPQARPAAKQSLQPQALTVSLQPPGAPQSLHLCGPSQSQALTASRAPRCPSQSLQPRGRAQAVAAPRCPSQSLQPPRRPHSCCLAGALQAVAAAPKCPSQSPQRPSGSLAGALQPNLTVAAGFRPPHSSRCIPQVLTVAAASRARIAVRIEAGRDGDDAATTGR